MIEAGQEMLSIFCEALERASPEDRAAYLNSACRSDLALRARIDALLQAHERAAGFLPEAFANGVDDQPTEQPGTLIGPYKLLEQIGEGGFGVVFMAEQQHPVRRKVALKVLKPGMDTRQVVARFEAERQALALMDHPNIAHVFDGGETTGGRPYFAMELVRGIAVTDFCDRNYLSVHERLALFISVCQAVQHAHQKGIIHRDLKPANVLVTMHDTAPVIKVIDFGIAKAIGQQLTDKTLFTNFAQFFGTPMYMSPEQAQLSGIDIDTRSDVYSLGVLLYELLTGTTPFDVERLRSAGYDEIRRIIREEEPVKPSTRLSTLGQAAATVSADRRSDPKRLSHSLRGELDWIVMKALEKDRDRRYESASAFAADVKRYQDDVPVLACPPSAGYRFRKFVRRNQVLLATTSVVTAALLIGATVAVWQAIVATRAASAETTAKETAVRREAETRAVLEFVESKILAAARPKGQDGGLGRDVALRQAIEAALPFVKKSFQSDPLIEARLRMTLGQSFHELGDAQIAIDQYQRARSIYADQLGPEHQVTLQSMHRLANGLEAVGQYAAARDLRWETLERQQRVLGPEHPDTLATMHNLGNSHADLNDQQAAFELREKTLALQKRVLGAEHPETIRGMNGLANSYHALGRYHDALALRKQTLGLYKAHPAFGPKHPQTLLTMHNVANSDYALGHYRDAEILFEEALATKKEVLGANHPDTLLTMNNLANAQHGLGRFEVALALREETLKLRRLHPDLGPDHPETLQSMNNLAVSYHKFARHEEALKLRLEVLERRQARLGPKHAATLNSMHSLGLSYAALNQHDKALAIRIETLTLRKAHSDLGPRHADTLRSMHSLAASYAAKGEHNEAGRLHEETLQLRNETLGKDHPETLQSMKDTATCWIAIGRGEEAVALIDECVRRGAGKESNLQLLADVLKLRLRHFERAKDAAGCRQTADLWENLNRSKSAGLLLAGRFRAVTANVISLDPRTPTPGATGLVQVETDRAMDWLRQAVAAGISNVGRTALEKDFAALHDREDFKQLIADSKNPTRK